MIYNNSIIIKELIILYQIMSKILLNVEYTNNIKFKIAFDTENNTKTFKNLKDELI